MKIKLSELKTIIKEETSKVLNEQKSREIFDKDDLKEQKELVNKSDKLYDEMNKLNEQYDEGKLKAMFYFLKVWEIANKFVNNTRSGYNKYTAEGGESRLKKYYKDENDNWKTDSRGVKLKKKNPNAWDENGVPN